MTRAEAVAYDQGVLAVLDIAARSAAAIRATSRRPVEAFAVVALEELADAARTLLIGGDDLPAESAPDVLP